MTATAPIKIPISFIGEAQIRTLTVDEEGFRKMAGIKNPSPDAARQKSWRIRSEAGIQKLPGGDYLISEVERGLKALATRRRMN